MTIQAIERAEEMWHGDSLTTMLQQWEESESKARQERIVTARVGAVGTVADLGCGNGRLAHCLDVSEEYWGYDASEDMLAHATGPKGGRFRTNFERRDVFASAPDRLFDVVILWDVAVHQNDPVAAVRRMMELWRGKRYIFSLVVGDAHEDLLASTVIAFSEFLGLLDSLNIINLHIEGVGSEKFGWALVEAKGGE